MQVGDTRQPRSLKAASTAVPSSGQGCIYTYLNDNGSAMCTRQQVAENRTLVTPNAASWYSLAERASVLPSQYGSGSSLNRLREQLHEHERPRALFAMIVAKRGWYRRISFPDSTGTLGSIVDVSRNRLGRLLAPQRRTGWFRISTSVTEHANRKPQDSNAGTDYLTWPLPEPSISATSFLLSVSIPPLNVPTLGVPMARCLLASLSVFPRLAFSNIIPFSLASRLRLSSLPAAFLAMPFLCENGMFRCA